MKRSFGPVWEFLWCKLLKSLGLPCNSTGYRIVYFFYWHVTCAFIENDNWILLLSLKEDGEKTLGDHNTSERTRPRLSHGIPKIIRRQNTTDGRSTVRAWLELSKWTKTAFSGQKKQSGSIRYGQWRDRENGGQIIKRRREESNGLQSNRIDERPRCCEHLRLERLELKAFGDLGDQSNGKT